MRRLREHAAIEPIGADWRVTLDGRPVRIPGGAELHLPSRRLAEAVAAEWQAAGASGTGPAKLPLTRLAGTGQARILPDPRPMVQAIARYGESDLLCYRAAGPAALAGRQAAAWQPWLDWAAGRFGARLLVTTGVMHVPQDQAALAALTDAVAAQPPLALAALGVAVPALGSLVLGLALAEDVLEAAAAHALASLDEAFQEELWGADAAAVARRRRIGEEVAVAARMLKMLRA